MYDKSFYITAKTSNNTFSFEKRTNKKLFVGALKQGTVEEVKIGDEIVFEDYNDDSELKSCKGLETFIQTKFINAPTYIFDNHNHAFYFWMKEKAAGSIKDGALLIHIDQHKDTRIPEQFISKSDSENLQKVFEYTNTTLNVGNFIPPAQEIGLVKDIIFLDSEYSLLNFDQKVLENPNIILDIDLDFFAPDSDYIGNDLKLKIIEKILPKAKIITICTSPYFIDQELAINYLKKISKVAEQYKE